MTPIPVLCCVTIKESVPAGNPLIGKGFLAVPALRALLHRMYPDNPTPITPAFLMPILRSTGVLQQATITQVDVKPLQQGRFRCTTSERFIMACMRLRLLELLPS